MLTLECVRRLPSVHQLLGSTLITRVPLAVDRSNHVSFYDKWVHRFSPNVSSVIAAGSRMEIVTFSWNSGSYRVLARTSDHHTDPIDISCFWNTDGTIKRHVCDLHLSAEAKQVSVCDCPVCYRYYSPFVFMAIGGAALFLTRSLIIALVAMIIYYISGWFVTNRPWSRLYQHNSSIEHLEPRVSESCPLPTTTATTTTTTATSSTNAERTTAITTTEINNSNSNSNNKSGMGRKGQMTGSTSTTTYRR